MPPFTETDHPRYVDAAGVPLMWADIKDLASETDALKEVRRRRLGRTLVRAMFLSASAAEIAGTLQLASNRHWTTYLLGTQAAFTSMCAVVSITSAPGARREDRAIILNSATLAARRR